MAVKIRLKRLGKIRQPHYRIVVVDGRAKRDGKTIEEVGIYRPKTNPSFMEVKSERVQYWLSVGAQPSEPVLAILKRTGDWQKFKGLPAPKHPVLQPAEAPDRRVRFDELLRAAHGEPDREATTAKKAAAPKPEKADPAKSERPAKKAAKATKTAPKPDQSTSSQDKAGEPAVSSESATPESAATPESEA